MGICLSLVKPRTKAWGVEVSGVVRSRTGKHFKEGSRDSAPLSCKLHIGVRTSRKVTTILEQAEKGRKIASAPLLGSTALAETRAIGTPGRSRPARQGFLDQAIGVAVEYRPSHGPR